jgi:hypothetical protein
MVVIEVSNFDVAKSELDYPGLAKVCWFEDFCLGVEEVLYLRF